jgi:outer membrane protein OmpA-like peptidoglycan-associated protein
MPHADDAARSFLFGSALAQALVLSLIPLGVAVAQTPRPYQPYPSYVRVTRDNLDISAWRAKPLVRMTAAKGTVLEVFHIEGDREHHRPSNWYWVTLPQDAAGTRAAGWIRGDAVEIAPPPQGPASATRASAAGAVPGRDARLAESGTMATSEPERVSAAAPTARPVIADVILHFPFDKSDLTTEARNTLASAVALPNAVAQGMVVALEGYADSTGSEPYNEKLGLARAETVRQYLAEQLRIPASTISVVSYGESTPAAPNTTAKGRARNRRVVIKVG